jgi:Ca2+-binding RTX toxin-like protein
LTIDGGEGDDSLAGGAGDDTLIGDIGNDTYYVGNSSDAVIELTGQGRDVVYASASYALTAGAFVEVLSTSSQAGTTAIALTGNELGQEIYGNAGANFIDGGGGADYLAGFGGDDVYVVDQAGDVVAEAPGGGRDIVYASAGYILTAGAQVEILSTISQAATTAIYLIGNELANAVYGNAGANHLDGGGGGDYLAGFGGNDSYVVDQAGDVIAEATGDGRDVVYARSSYTLTAGAEVEILSTIQQSATTAIDLTGNGFGNEIYGNAGANVLNGGGGADYLMGFGGADIFAFTTALGAGNVDAILDFAAGSDRIALDDAVFAGLSLGVLSAAAFRAGSAAGDADDRIVYNSATGQLFFDADGNGAGAAMLFATLNPGASLTASDFTVI